MNVATATRSELAGFRAAIKSADISFTDPTRRADRMLVIMTGQSLSVGNNGQPALSVSALDPYSLAFAGGVKSTSGEMGSFISLAEDNETNSFGETSGEVGLSHVALRYNSEVYAQYGIPAAAAPAIVGITVGRGSYELTGLRKDDVSGTYDVLAAAITAVEAVATADSKTSSVLGVIFRQGESDNSTPALTRAQYLTELTGYLDEINVDAVAATDQDQPVVMVSYQTSAGVIGVNGSNIGTLGQHDMLYADERFTIACPMYPVYAAGYLNTSDGVHSTNFGYALLGAYEGRALARLAHGEKPWPVSPISAKANGQILEVKFRVPVPPLVFDTTAVPAVTNYGFSVSDGTGAVTILSVELANDDTVRIYLDRTLGSSPVVRYALASDFSGSSVDRGTAGNLRDSDTETVSIAGRVHTLRNWAIHSETSITVASGASRFYVLNTDATSYADILDNYDATVIGSNPTWAATHAVLQRSASLDTNVSPGAEFSAIFVWQHDTSQDTVLFGNFGPNLAAVTGAMVLVSGSTGVCRFYRNDVISTPSAPQVIIPTSRNGQWVALAVTFKATEVIVYSPHSNEGLGRVTGSGFAIDASPTMALGGARYTQSHAGTVKMAAAMLFDTFLTTPEVDAHIALLRAKLDPLGIDI